MARRYLHIVSADGLRSYACEPRGLRLLEHYPPEAADQMRLHQWLSAKPGAQHIMRCDIGNEQWVRESLPGLSRAERPAWIRHRLAQRFPDSSARLAMPCARGREVLLASQGHTPVLNDWLEIFERSGARLSALLSPTLLLAPQLPEPGIWLIVDKSGLRIFELDRAGLRFVRVIAASGLDPAERERLYATETRRTLQYLGSTDTSRQLQLVADRAPDGLMQELARNGISVASRCHPSRLARHGWPFRRAENESLTTLLDALTVRWRRGPQFAPAATRAHFLKSRARRLAIAGCASLSALSLVASVLLHQERQVLERSRAAFLHAAARDAHAATGLAAAAGPSSSTRTLIDLEPLLRAIHQRPAIEALLLPLSEVLAAHAQIRLEALEWRYPELAGGSAQERGLSLLVRARVMDGPAAAESDAEHVLGAIRHFVAGLQGRGLLIEIRSLPYEARAGRPLRASDFNARSAVGFELGVRFAGAES